MNKIKDSVLFTFQVIGGVITFLTVTIAAFWWFAGFYYQSNFNDELMKEVAVKHEVQMSEVIKENNQDHTKIFKELVEIKLQLIQLSTMLSKKVAEQDSALILNSGGNNG